MAKKHKATQGPLANAIPPAGDTLTAPSSVLDATLTSLFATSVREQVMLNVFLTDDGSPDPLRYRRFARQATALSRRMRTLHSPMP